MDKANLRLSKKAIPFFVALLIIVLTAALLLSRPELGKALVDKGKVALSASITKLKLDRIPFLKRFVIEEEAAEIPEEPVEERHWPELTPAGLEPETDEEALAHRVHM